MRAILLLHGFATSRDDFERIAPILSTRYDEVCCPNLPNHGEGTQKETISCKRILDFVLATFDNLKSRHKTVDVIGYSMGGALATYVASQRKIGRLVLLAPANKYFAPAFMISTLKSMIATKNRQKSLATSKEINDKAKKSINTGITVTDDGSMTMKELFADFGMVAKLLGKIIRKYTPKNMVQFKNVIKSCNQSLCIIDAPTLLIWGKTDQLVPFVSIKHIVSCCRNDATKVIVYPDLSHIMLYSQMHYRITNDILCFLEQTSPPLLCYKSGTNKKLHNPY